MAQSTARRFSGKHPRWSRVLRSSVLVAGLALTGFPATGRPDERVRAVAVERTPGETKEGADSTPPAAERPAEVERGGRADQVVVPPDAKAKAPETVFVDRDGDGIQDGREHRFRSKRGTRSRERHGGGDGSGAGNQVRVRRGAQDGSGDGGGGGGPGGGGFGGGNGPGR